MLILAYDDDDDDDDDFDAGVNLGLFNTDKWLSDV
jgi:hypothetical protein